MDFLAYLKKTGFADVASAGETGFNSSPKTRGMLVRARKPGLQNQKSVASSITAETHAPLDAEGASKELSANIDTLLQRGITLGAEKIKLIDTDGFKKGLKLRTVDFKKKKKKKKKSPYIYRYRPRIPSVNSNFFPNKETHPCLKN